ncbi:MAG: hypothetical protein HY865_04245 [Chloroflexi bacterium]|nr:hypothetical protein [Chloroflexota bacterium]
MKKISVLLALVFFLAACDVFGTAPQPVPTWIVPPSPTPNIITATPIIFTPTLTNTLFPGVTEIIPVSPTMTDTPPPTLTSTLPPPTETFTPVPTSTPVKSLVVDILGCNTGIDITHGMGEVTNAYVTVKNTGTADLPNTCALLRAIDEDREHPDKKICVPNLPVGNQVNLKLTVDSVYQQDTIIQVDASSDDVLLLRVDKPSCTDISLFGGAPSDVGVVKPIQ